MQRPKRSREISDQVEMMERRTTRATPAPPRGANPSSGGPWQMAVNPASEKPSRRRGASCELENPISETQPRSAPNCVREEPHHLPTKRASVPVRPACRAATRRTLLPLHVMSSPIHCAWNNGHGMRAPTWRFSLDTCPASESDSESWWLGARKSISKDRAGCTDLKWKKRKATPGPRAPQGPVTEDGGSRTGAKRPHRGRQQKAMKAGLGPRGRTGNGRRPHRGRTATQGAGRQSRTRPSW